MDKAATAPADPVAGLIDIPLPIPVSLWPETWASQIAIAVLAVALIALVGWLAWRWWVNRYRREALADLDDILRGQPTVDALALLVRRTALAVFPRETVAPLAGKEWLAFLDRSYGGSEFSQGAGRSLSRSPYQRSADAAGDVNAAAALVRRWIRTHHV